MAGVRRSRVTRERLIHSLPASGAPGRTLSRPPGTSLPHAALSDGDALAELDRVAASSPTGWTLFIEARRVTLVVPPFPVERALDADGIDAQPLVELLERPRTLGVFLLRLGGFTVGVLRDGYVVDSKTGQRFVKGRHRKGGQSQRRFERIREGQVRELFDAACEAARAKLVPYEREIEHVFLGGDRRTLAAFRKRCDCFDGFGSRLMVRVLPVAGDPRRSSLDEAAREIWKSDVYAVELPVDAAGVAPESRT